MESSGKLVRGDGSVSVGLWNCLLSDGRGFRDSAKALEHRGFSLTGAHPGSWGLYFPRRHLRERTAHLSQFGELDGAGDYTRANALPEASFRSPALKSDRLAPGVRWGGQATAPRSRSM